MADEDLWCIFNGFYCGCSKDHDGFTSGLLWFDFSILMSLFSVHSALLARCFHQRISPKSNSASSTCEGSFRNPKTSYRFQNTSTGPLAYEASPIVGKFSEKLGSLIVLNKSESKFIGRLFFTRSFKMWSTSLSGSRILTVETGS